MINTIGSTVANGLHEHLPMCSSTQYLTPKRSNVNFAIQLLFVCLVVVLASPIPSLL